MANMIDRTGAAALIPEQEVNEIIQGLPESSVAMRLFRSVRMSTKTQSQPVLASLPIAGWVTGDNGLKVTSNVSWTNRVLTAEELAVIVPIPEAVLDDAEYDIWGEVRPRIIEAMGEALDAAVLFGTNKPASWPVAIEDGAAAAGNTLVSGAVAGTNFDVEISDLMALVEADGFPVSHITAAQIVKGALRRLRDSAGQPIIQTVDNQRSIYDTPLVYVTNGAFDTARARIVAGDFSQAVVGVRQDFQYKLLDQAVIQNPDGTIAFNLAQQDMVAIRVTARFGFQVSNPINKLNTNAATRYPFAVLRPAGFV